jgi:polyisoprenyl-teichoic acid--peptidoglycan teichoic acid transferase
MAQTGLRQDMQVVKKQAGQFPNVGMTLRSYQYDPRDRHKRLDQNVVVKRHWRRRLFGKVTLKRTVITLLIVGLSVGGWLGGKFIYDAHKLFGGSILSILKTTKLKGEDSGRVTILLAGNSADDPGHDGADLTDSIMLISIDTVHHKAFLLSIPRDLWVDVDNSGHEKINAAYVTGQSDTFSADGYPNGGMGQLEQVVSNDFNIPIDYYALINYQALKQSVDAVGGITVNIQSSDPRGLFDPSIDYATHGPLVKLTNGEHRLDGEQALDLARARGDAYGSYGFAGSDFTRTQDQREMLVALKSKAVSVGVISNPAKLSNLFDAIGNNVKTDFTLSEVHRLYDLTQNISGGNIQSLSLNNADGKNLLASFSAPDGESALIPAAGIDNYYDIQSFVNRQISSNPVVQEAANVVVLNGTTTNGLATKVKKQLTNQSVTVSAIGDASGTPATTSIINNSDGKMPATSALLVKQFGNHLTTVNPYAGVYNANFIVVLGADQVPTTPSTTNTANP